MKEKFVSFEQAKVLKELGFPQIIEDIYLYYDIKGNEWQNVYDIEDYYIMAPISLVQQWFREKKKLHIYMTPLTEEALSNKVCSYGFDIYVEENGGLISDYRSHKTYEKALEAAIDKCIELLKYGK